MVPNAFWDHQLIKKGKNITNNNFKDLFRFIYRDIIKLLGGVMHYIKWSKNGFWRQYGDIGLCYQQRQNKTVVVNKQAALFLQFISRENQTIPSVLKQIRNLFPNISDSQLCEDFMALVNPLIQQGILILCDHNGDALSEEQRNNPVVLESRSATSTRQYLDVYFQDKPQLMSLQIEITPNCNLRCVHCYLGFGHIHPDIQTALPTETICKVINEFASLGGLHLTLTGGEILLNKGLFEILDCARKNDLSITLLTNGTLLNESLAACLSTYNLAKVQLSLYSMCNIDHDSITQVDGSCEKTKQAVKILLKNQIPVQLACVTMKENQNSFVSVMAFAKENNLVVKVGNTIQALENFGKDNLGHRINILEAEDFIRKYFTANPKAAFDLVVSSQQSGSDDFVCGLGRYALNLNARGKYTPCAGFNLELGDVNRDSLYDVFYHSKHMHVLRKVRLKDYKKCLSCKDRNYCDLCPGKLYSESGGDMFKLSDYFCEVAHINRRIAEEFVAAHSKKKAPYD